jgi:hypothetical protein
VERSRPATAWPVAKRSIEALKKALNAPRNRSLPKAKKIKHAQK